MRDARSYLGVCDWRALKALRLYKGGRRLKNCRCHQDGTLWGDGCLDWVTFAQFWVAVDQVWVAGTSGQKVVKSKQKLASGKKLVKKSGKKQNISNFTTLYLQICAHFCVKIECTGVGQ